jgi:hypothetical protein
MGWTSQGSDTCTGKRFFPSSKGPDQLWATESVPALFPGDKTDGAWSYLSPPSAEVQNEWGLYLYFPPHAFMAWIGKSWSFVNFYRPSNFETVPRPRHHRFLPNPFPFINRPIIRCGMVKVTKSVVKQNTKREVSLHFNLAHLRPNRSGPEFTTRHRGDAQRRHKTFKDNRAPRIEGFPKNTRTYWTTYFLVFFTRGARKLTTYRGLPSTCSIH